jgi:hypothetical protein
MSEYSLSATPNASDSSANRRFRFSEGIGDGRPSRKPNRIRHCPAHPRGSSLGVRKGSPYEDELAPGCVGSRHAAVGAAIPTGLTRALPSSSTPPEAW